MGIFDNLEDATKEAFRHKKRANRLRKKVIKLQAKIEELEEDNRWIPVNERLPELVIDIPHSKDVLLVHKRFGLQTGYYGTKYGWIIYGSYLSPDRYQKYITHWKPIILPKP